MCEKLIVSAFINMGVISLSQGGLGLKTKYTASYFFQTNRLNVLITP